MVIVWPVGAFRVLQGENLDCSNNMRIFVAEVTTNHMMRWRSIVDEMEEPKMWKEGDCPITGWGDPEEWRNGQVRLHSVGSGKA